MSQDEATQAASPQAGDDSLDGEWECVDLPNIIDAREDSNKKSKDELDHDDHGKKPVMRQNSIGRDKKSGIAFIAKKDCDCSTKITSKQLSRYRRDFCKDETGRMAQNALQFSSVSDVTTRRDLIQSSTDFTFCVEIDGMQVTDQEDSGRCWLFAALNLLRLSASANLDVEDFELSESFLAFYDKMEKANAFLEVIIRTSGEPLDSRIMESVLDDPIGDGGDWPQAASLVAKYGLVPKSAFPETFSSSNTDGMNDSLEQLLMGAAFDIRKMMASPLNTDNRDDHSAESEDAALKDMLQDTVRKYKDQRMDDVFRVLCIHLGTPPEKFHWQWRDNDYNFHTCGNITPLEFASKFVDLPYQTYIAMMQDPREEHEYYRLYKVDFSQTVVGGKDMVFFNIPADDMKNITENMLKDGLPVWFACNVGTEFDDDQGLWDNDLYDLAGLYRVPIRNPKLSKADRIRWGNPMGDHAMLFTGVDYDRPERPRRWRVENSWGDYGGDNGYYTMNDNWFDENVFEIVADPSYLTDQMKKGLEKEPILLPAWDPLWTKCGGKRWRRWNRRRKLKV
jgi:bleomycin hydrolase